MRTSEDTTHAPRLHLSPRGRGRLSSVKRVHVRFRRATARKSGEGVTEASRDPNPLTPPLSPPGEREQTERAAPTWSELNHVPHSTAISPPSRSMVAPCIQVARAE